MKLRKPLRSSKSYYQKDTQHMPQTATAVEVTESPNLIPDLKKLSLVPSKQTVPEVPPKKQSSSPKPDQGKLNFTPGGNIAIVNGPPRIKLAGELGTTEVEFTGPVTLNGFDLNTLYFHNNISVNRSDIVSNVITTDSLQEDMMNAAKASIHLKITNALNSGLIGFADSTGSTGTDITTHGFSVNVSETTTAATTSVVNNFIFNGAADIAFNVTTGSSGGIFYSNEWKPLTKQEKLRAMLKQRMAPAAIINHNGSRPRALGRGADFGDAKQNEIVALQLLRQMVPHDVFKKYLKYGFVTVNGPSGLTYQIQRKSHNIIVWDKGQKVSSLCVYLQDTNIPPTDEVVAKMLICQYDEPDIWKRANIHWKVSNDDHIKHITSTLGLPSHKRMMGNFNINMAGMVDLTVANGGLVVGAA